MLYLYLDNVIPNAYGISKDFLYCLRCRRQNYQQVEQNEARASLNQRANPNADSDNIREFNGNDPIRLESLSKKFGKFTAVDKMTVSIKGNEVFTILGHNGAGKTTAIYMLTGMLKPTSGEATLYDNTITNEIDEVRRSLGLCQQFDVLYNELTAYEHLLLTCRIKGIQENMERQINETLELVMLQRHRDKKPTGMSGGMKRKLSLAIALIGNSRTIILDEPTSGLDVESRR